METMSDFALWPSHALPLEIIIHLLSTMTAAFHLQPPKRERCQIFPFFWPVEMHQLFYGLLGAPQPTFLCSWSTWWRVREKKEDPSELQEHCTSGVQSHCKLNHLPRASCLRGAPGDHRQNSVQVVLEFAQCLTIKHTVLQSALETKVCKLKEYIIIIDVFCLNDCLSVWPNKESC